MTLNRHKKFDVILTGTQSRRGDWDVNDPNDPAHGKNWNASPEEKPEQNGQRANHADSNPGREDKLRKKKSDFKQSGYAQSDASTAGTPDRMEMQSSKLRSGAGILGKTENQESDSHAENVSSSNIQGGAIADRGNKEQKGSAEMTKQGVSESASGGKGRMPDNPRYGKFATDTGKSETPPITGTQDE